MDVEHVKDSVDLKLECYAFYLKLVVLRMFFEEGVILRLIYTEVELSLLLFIILFFASRIGS